MSVYDQAGRYVIKRRPSAFFTWRAPGLWAAYRLVRWQDTRTLPFPGEPDRVCDTVAEFQHATEPRRRPSPQLRCCAKPVREPACTSRKRTAVVPINATLRTALEEACELAETDWVIEFRGRPVGRIVKGFKKAVIRSGVAPCTIHDLRRTCASWLLQEGASFAQVAAYLGDTEEMIRRHYGHFSPDWLRPAAESLDR